MLSVAFPAWITWRVHNYKPDGGLGSYHVLVKYGNFYTDYKLDGWRVHFFVIQHWCENMAFGFISVRLHIHFPHYFEGHTCMHSGNYGEFRRVNPKHHHRVFPRILHAYLARASTVRQSEDHGPTALFFLC